MMLLCLAIFSMPPINAYVTIKSQGDTDRFECVGKLSSDYIKHLDIITIRSYHSYFMHRQGVGQPILSEEMFSGDESLWDIREDLGAWRFRTTDGNKNYLGIDSNGIVCEKDVPDDKSLWKESKYFTFLVEGESAARTYTQIKNVESGKCLNINEDGDISTDTCKINMDNGIYFEIVNAIGSGGSGTGITIANDISYRWQGISCITTTNNYVSDGDLITIRSNEGIGYFLSSQGAVHSHITALKYYGDDESLWKVYKDAANNVFYFKKKNRNTNYLGIDDNGILKEKNSLNDKSKWKCLCHIAITNSSPKRGYTTLRNVATDLYLTVTDQGIISVTGISVTKIAYFSFEIVK